MKKWMISFSLVGVFAAGALIGSGMKPAQAATCFYRCICSVPYKCCTTPTGTTCKVDHSAPIGCPQIAC